MLEYLQGVMDMFVSVIAVLVNIVKGLFEFVALLPDWLAFLHLSVGLLPSLLVSFIMFGIFISALLMIVGRN